MDTLNRIQKQRQLAQQEKQKAVKKLIDNRDAESQLNACDREYHAFLEHVLTNGSKKDDRTGTGTVSVFGYQMRFDLQEGFPLLTTKKVHFPAIVHELVWFLSGSTNIKYLVDNNVRIWNEWPYETYKASDAFQGEDLKEFVEKIREDAQFAEQWGELGAVYGKQWIRWPAADGSEINQIKNVVDMIKANPNSRRMVVSGWNVADIQGLVGGTKSAPPLCHTMFQFYVSDGKLSCQLYQRSADIFLGVPFNIASYSLLTHMIAQVCDLEVGEFIHTFGDAHIYLNHLEQVEEQLSRTSRPQPTVRLNPKIDDVFAFIFEDIELLNYDPHEAIRAPIAV